MAHGIDATGADTYAVVVAAPSGNSRYHYVSATCDTNDAVISLDAGTIDFARIVAGEPAVVFPLYGQIGSKAIHGKNAGAGSNYANLVVNAW